MNLKAIIFHLLLESAVPEIDDYLLIYAFSTLEEQPQKG
jgi:hypothetical protein